jgi:ornithine cyclodeaminase/alanine dehydrogenase-like protein (mu-crystallin family)
LTLFLSRAEVERCLDAEELIEALAAAFRELSAGRASVPPRVAAQATAGLLGAMPGYVGGVLAAKLVSVFPGNARRGLPSHQALIAVFDGETGAPLAVLDGELITALRTAAASALATRTLARPAAAVLAVVGAGVQGRSHLLAMAALRRFEEVRVASRTAEHAGRLAGEFGARAIPDIETAVRGADVVCLCTHADAPVIRREWLAAGAHVNSVGYGPGPELDAATIAAAGVLCVESRTAFAPYPAGCHELAGVASERGSELGEILAGARPGRSSPEQLTVYKSMGHAVEDAAAADLVLRKARQLGLGAELEL